MANSDTLKKIEQIVELRSHGSITEEEFELLKKELLAQAGNKSQTSTQAQGIGPVAWISICLSVVVLIGFSWIKINSVLQTTSTVPSVTPTNLNPGESWTEPYTGMDFVWVPEGCFQMGCGSWTSNCRDNEKPVHEVCLDGFWLGKYPVTQAQWETVMGSNPSEYKGPNNPVESVSWDDAQVFIKNLDSQLAALSVRLPTESEWEHACRGGGRPEKYCGGNNVDSVAWYSGNSGGATQPVGGKSPNALDIYDMSGNVWEWVSDFFNYDSYAKSHKLNPQGPSSGFYHVIRGGSLRSSSQDCRASHRGLSWPSFRGGNVGFRLLLSPQISSNR